MQPRPRLIIFAAAAVRVNRTAHLIPVLNSVTGPPALCRTCGTAASNRQEPATCDTGVAGPRRSTFSLGELVYFGGAGGGNDGSGGDSGGASCAAAPPLRSGSGLLQQAVGTRLIVVGSQSAAS